MSSQEGHMSFLGLCQDTRSLRASENLLNHFQCCFYCAPHFLIALPTGVLWEEHLL